MTGQAHERPAITSLRLLAVLNVLSEYASLIKWGSSSGAPPTDTPLTHFVSPRREKCGLKDGLPASVIPDSSLYLS